MPPTYRTSTLVAIGLLVAWLSGLGPSALLAQAGDGPRVFISVDMEGLAGAVDNQATGASGRDYEHFRKIMAGEANAAIRGAFAAGASDVLVRDSHGAKQNLLPGDLHPAARLLRGVSQGPKNMMEGIDETFDAVVFIGYHARAGTPNAIMEHTSTGNVIDFQINGVSMPEAGYNALVAGLVGVPVAFVSGDQAFVDQARELFGEVDAVATKREIQRAALSLSPAEANVRIEEGVTKALSDLSRFAPYQMDAPYTMVLKVTNERPLYPGAVRTGPGEFTFTSDSLLEILNAFNAMK